jgi:hypothetical protein
MELSAGYCQWKGRAVQGEPYNNGQISGPCVETARAASVAPATTVGYWLSEQWAQNIQHSRGKQVL